MTYLKSRGTNMATARKVFV